MTFYASYYTDNWYILDNLVLTSLFLSSFIEKYGTHVIVGIKMGGKDMICMKQQHSSPLPPVDVQKKLKDMADKMFVDGVRSTMNSDKFYDREKVRKSIYLCPLS